MRNHANTEGSGTNGWKPLQKVAESGRAEVVKAWLKGAKIERAGQEGRIPLHVTARFGHFDLAKMLLDKGANIEALCKDEWKALHVAARFGHVDLAKMLLDKRANKEATDRNGWSPLHLATSLGHVDLKGANIKTVDMGERTPLHWAARVDLTKTLLGQGANIEAADKTGLTPLHLAAQFGHVDLAKILLNKGANTETANKDGRTPLIPASRFRRFKMVEMLRDNPSQQKRYLVPLRICSIQCSNQSNCIRCSNANPR